MDELKVKGHQLAYQLQQKFRVREIHVLFTGNVIKRKVDELFSVPRLAERPDQSQTRVLEAQVSVETRLGSTKTQEMFITQL